MLKYYFKYLSRLSRNEIIQLNRLTYQDGRMRNWLKRKDLKPLSVVVICQNEKNKILGWLCASVMYTDTCFIDLGIFVNSKYRRQGIGKQLVIRFEELVHLLIAGKKKTINTEPHNIIARKFWQSMGYTNCKRFVGTNLVIN